MEERKKKRARMAPVERTETEMMAPPFRRIQRVDEEILNIYSQQEKTQVIRK